MIQLTEEEFKNYLETVHTFQKEFSDTNQRYKTDLNVKELEKELHKLARNYQKYVFVATYYVNYGDELIANGQKEAGILYLQIAKEIFRKKYIEDFEAEEDFYYKFVEKDLLEGLYTYVISHKSRFR